MQAGFPFKKKITTRPSTINYGGDGRYLFVLCQRADTVVVIDLISDVGVIPPKTLANTNRVATIALGGASYSSFNIVYRSMNLEVWVFKALSAIIIDADPSSPTFCQVKETRVYTGNSLSAVNNTVIYQPDGDFFLSLSQKIFAGTNIRQNISSLQFPTAFFSLLNSRMYGVAAIQGWGFVVLDMDTINATIHFKGTGGEGFKIGNKYYMGNLRFSEDGVIEASLAGGILLGSTAYDTATKTIIAGYNLQCNLLTVNPFSNKANLQSNISDQISGTVIQIKSVIYSPFSGKTYLQHGNYSAPTGINRIIVIDTSRSTSAEMVCGYHVVDDHATTALYAPSTTMCLNTIRTSEYVE